MYKNFIVGSLIVLFMIQSIFAVLFYTTYTKDNDSVFATQSGVYRTTGVGDDVTPRVEVSVIMSPGTGSGNTYTFSVEKGSNLDALNLDGWSQPTRMGWRFDGYWRELNNTQWYDANMQPNRQITVDGEVTIKAQFIQINHSVKFNPNGGEGDTITKSIPDSSYRNGEKLGIAAPHRIGYKFSGYFENSSENNRGAMYYDSNMTHKLLFTGKNDTVFTVYAQWEKIVHTINFDPNGGDGDVVEKLFGDSATWDNPLDKIPTRTGYKFLGFFENSDENDIGEMYYDESMKQKKLFVYPNNTTVTIYAHWKKVAFIVTLDSNRGGDSGEDGTASVEVVLDSDMPMINVHAPTRTGYNFVGYFDTPDQVDGTKQYYTSDMKSKQKWDVEGDATLYAHWSLGDAFKVTFDANGGNFPDDGSLSKVLEWFADEQVVIDPNSFPPPEWKGYKFDGFFDDRVKGTQYIDPQMNSIKAWDKNDNGTLYAHWTGIPLLIKINLSGGVWQDGSDIASLDVQFGQAITLSSIPTKKNYIFDGLYDENDVQYVGADGGNKKIWDKLNDATLIAKWSDEPINLPLNYAMIIFIAALAGCLAAGAIYILVIRKRHKAPSGGRGGGYRGRR